MRETLSSLRKSAVYASLVAWRTRAFWLRVGLCFLLGAAFLVNDEAANYDVRFTVRGARTPDSRIVIIDISERDWSLLQDSSQLNMIRPQKEILVHNDGYFWNADIWQRLLANILVQKPAAVGVAFYFADMRASQLTETQRVVFSDPRLAWGAEVDAAGRPLVPEMSATYNARAGVKSLRVDDDGIVRRFSSTLVKLPALPLVISQLSDPSKRESKQNSWQTPSLINFIGPAGTFPTIGFREILEGRLDPDELQGKIVLIGSRSNPLDQMQTPLGRMSRVEILANATDNVLGSKWILRAPYIVYLIGLIALMLLSTWILTNYPQSVALILFVWIGTLWTALSAWTFDSFYVWIPVLSPVLQLGFTYIIFLSYQLSQNEQRTWRLEQERMYIREIEELKSNFVSMMSHDLKTPIAKIQAIVDRMLLVATGEMTDDLKSLRRSSDDLQRYIQSILQVTRIEAQDFRIKKEVVDINETIEKVVTGLAPLAFEKRIRTEQNLEPMFSIEADSTLIQEVIHNLIENAIKYTPTNGTVKITSQEKDDNVFVIVEDTGVGIAPEDQDKIWEKFTRGKNLEFDAKGSGLGLYLVKYFVELHGGRVFLESQPNVGTKIGFSIPVAQESAADSEDVAREEGVTA